MLNEIIRQKSIEAGKLLNHSNIKLSPKENSPLSKLHSLGKQEVFKGEEISLESFNDTPLEGNVNLFDLELNQIVKETSKALNDQIIFARTKVVPIVKELSDKLIDTVNKRMTNTDLDIKILKESLPLPLQTEIFLDLISDDLKFIPAKYAFSKLTFNNTKEELQKINLLELLKTNNPILDSAFLSFIETNNLLLELNHAFESMYYDIDGNVINNDNPNVLLSIDLNDYTRLKNALYYYFISLAIEDNPVQGTVGDMVEYKKYFSNLKILCASVFEEAIKKFERYEKNNTLIKDINKKNKTITVIESIYNKYLETGGMDSALFGFYFLHNRDYSVTSLEQVVDSIDTSVKAYESRVRLINESNKLNEVYIIKDSLLQIMDEFFVDTFINKKLNSFLVEEQSKDDIYNTINNPEYIFFKNKAKEIIIELNDYEVKDLVDVVMYVVCNSIFYKTSAYDILKGIELAKSLNTNLDSNREAALLSVFNYINKFVFSQIDVK